MRRILCMLVLLVWAADRVAADRCAQRPGPDDCTGYPEPRVYHGEPVVVGAAERPAVAPGNRQAGPHPRRDVLPAVSALRWHGDDRVRHHGAHAQPPGRDEGPPHRQLRRLQAGSRRTTSTGAVRPPTARGRSMSRFRSTRCSTRACTRLHDRGVREGRGRPLPVHGASLARLPRQRQAAAARSGRLRRITASTIEARGVIGGFVVHERHPEHGRQLCAGGDRAGGSSRGTR